MLRVGCVIVAIIPVDLSLIDSFIYFSYLNVLGTRNIFSFHTYKKKELIHCLSPCFSIASNPSYLCIHSSIHACSSMHVHYQYYHHNYCKPPHKHVFLS
eukprot:m.102990 g.102990  ORF g.102990 m.102990 type:complete len:99 (+) comp9088_c5_seq2:14-310(+)